jgi:hypothetical protein
LDRAQSLGLRVFAVAHSRCSLCGNAEVSLEACGKKNKTPIRLWRAVWASTSHHTLCGIFASHTAAQKRQSLGCTRREKLNAAKQTIEISIYIVSIESYSCPSFAARAELFLMILIPLRNGFLPQVSGALTTGC